MHRFCYLWFITQALAAWSRAASPAQHSSLAALPTLGTSPADTVAIDYLVAPIARTAEAYRSADGRSLILDNGLIRRSWQLVPNAACVAFDDRRTGASLLRSVRPEARITLDGKAYSVGGLQPQPNHAYLSPDWLETMASDPEALQFEGFALGEPKARLVWKRVRHHAPDATWPPRGIHLRMDYGAPASPSGVRVSVHYEMYDGVPVMSKWLTVHNGTDRPILVDRFTLEELAVVEHANWVEHREGVALPRPANLHIETDMAFGGFTPGNANRHAVHWRTDPLYTSQVNWERRQPCLAVVEPTYGPAQTVAPGSTFETFRAFELVFDGTDRERRGLALRRMYRTIAPWVTENPLMHHLLANDPAKIRRAIDQAADVGFEMIILSFGSGFNLEDSNPATIRQWKDLADYAHAKGIEIGGYSLLSSRRIGDGNDIISPEGQRPTHGTCPALTSPWGQQYYATLYRFFEQTGMDVLEHDGPYPGDVDVTARPPLQAGEQDSRWVQWRIASDFYRWCRGQGIYLNAPDYYYLSGSTKCGMGYREVNWSLPRAQQLIHTRQNIYDGTWTKTPSMGWMFVPLAQYHGGGAAATVEPLDDHLDHYRGMMLGNLGLGVQACYRGPRLFDTDRTRAMVKQTVDWFKAYRDILESDVIHGRRADGRDVDWMLHVNPRLDIQGLLCVYNPLNRKISRTLRVNLYYTGLTDRATVSLRDADPQTMDLARDYTIDLSVSVPPQDMAWYVIRSEP